MKTTATALFFLVTFLAALPATAAERVVVVGRTSVIPLEGRLLEVDNRKPNVASVEADANGDALLVSGRGEGELTLRYTLQSGRVRAIRIQVLPFDPLRIRNAVLDELDGLDDVDAGFRGGNLVLTGHVALPSDVRRINRIAQKFDSIVVDHVRRTRVGLEALALATRREIGIASIHVVPDEETDELVLQGTAASAKVAHRAERIAHKHHPSVRNELEVRHH